jgi:hypothetical protein
VPEVRRDVATLPAWYYFAPDRLQPAAIHHQIADALPYRREWT